MALKGSHRQNTHLIRLTKMMLPKNVSKFYMLYAAKAAVIDRHHKLLLNFMIYTLECNIYK